MCDTKGNDFIQSYLNETVIEGKSLYFTTVKLENVIGVIENVDHLDAFQLVMEMGVTALAVFGNILNIIVLWEVSVTHPAQALRLALAITDFFTGVSHCLLGICDHSYFLWCARELSMCDYEVDVVLFSNRLEIIRRGYPMLASIVFMVMFTSSFAYLVVSAVDRFIAIYRPLDYPSIVTMKLVRTQILFWLCLSIAYTFGMITRGDYTSWKSAYRPDDKTSIVFMDPYHYFVNGMVHKSYFLLVIVMFIGLILSTLWYLKKAGRARRALTSKDMKDETEIEMTKTLILVIFAFLFSVVPSYTRHFFGRRVLCNYVNFFVTWLFLSSSTMNFLIYNVRNPAFRRRTFQILHKGLSSITSKLNPCKLNRDEGHKDLHRDRPKSRSNMLVDTNLQPEARLRIIGSTKSAQYVSTTNIGKTINPIDIQMERNKININKHSIKGCNGNSFNTLTNNNNNINQTSSKQEKYKLEGILPKTPVQTSAICNKENFVLHQTSPIISNEGRSKYYSSSEVSFINDTDLHTKTSLVMDLKFRLEEDKVEFTLHM